MKKTTLALLFNDLDQIMLCMKKRGFGVGRWNGAGGKVMEDETIVHAAVRELIEETQVDISVNDLTERGVMHFYFDGNEDWNQSVYLFTGKYNGSFEETEEMKPQWWNISEIPYENMWEDDKFWLPRVLNGENIEGNFYFDLNGKLRDYKFIK